MNAVRMLSRLVVVVVCLSGVVAAAQEAARMPAPELAPEVVYVREVVDGKSVCRSVTGEEAKRFAAGDAPVHVIYPERGRVSLASGLRITILATDSLEANPTAKAAFIRAAQIWEGRIANPVSVTIKVDFGPTRFGTPYPSPTILGSANGSSWYVSYPSARSALLARADNAAESALYNSLPFSSVPTDLGPASKVLGTLTQLRTLGYNISDDPLPNVGFNSAYPFDFDPSDGIDPDKVDFEAVTVHELGHVLGFGSAVGMRELYPDTENAPTIWDLFRFREGVTSATFQTAQRPMSSGGVHVHFAGGNSLQMSTGRPDQTGGDEQQSSHWKDDALTGTYIGLMDPNLAEGVRGTLRQADIDAFGVMGYNVGSGSAPITPTPAAPSNLTATGISSSAIRLNWQDNSSNETEFRIEEKNSSGVFVDLGAVGANVTTVNVTGYSAGQSGTFRVRARNGAGNSGYSNEATGTTSGGTSACIPNATTVCLLNSRFRVSIDYLNQFANPPQPGSFVGAKLVAGVQNPDVATFGLSSAQAIEVVVRIQDARPFGNRFDIYYGGLTDLEYTVRVTDTQTGTTRTYRNAPGTVGGGVDRSSFPASVFGPNDPTITSGGYDSFVADGEMPSYEGGAPSKQLGSVAAIEPLRGSDVSKPLGRNVETNDVRPAACSEIEPNDIPIVADRLTLGLPCTGNAALSDSASYTYPNPAGPAWKLHDLFKVTTTSAGPLTVTLNFTNGSADLDLFLFSLSGTSLIKQDASIGSTTTESLSATVAAGTYYVAVSAFAGSSSYSLVANGSGGGGGGGTSPCVTSGTTVCLQDGRFRVSINYLNQFANPPQPGTFAGAKLVAGSQNPDVATFGLSSAQAIEVVVRIQDVRPYGIPRFDIYYGGLTDLEYTVSITDTQTGNTRTYRNPPGTVGGGVDRTSFPAN